jgi:hypothetical protein
MWDIYKLTWWLTEPLLGTIPKNRDVWSEHVRTQLTGEDEAELMEQAEDAHLADEAEVGERGWTTFYVDEAGRPILFDYQLKGFLKEAANTTKETLKLKNLRHHVEQEVFVFPRRLVLGDAVDGYIERPLRAMTQKGPRVTVVRSDRIDPDGRRYEHELRVLATSKIDSDVLNTILGYAAYKGLGQWRNGGYGRFEFTLAT